MSKENIKFLFKGPQHPILTCQFDNGTYQPLFQYLCLLNLLSHLPVCQNFSNHLTMLLSFFQQIWKKLHLVSLRWILVFYQRNWGLNFEVDFSIRIFLTLALQWFFSWLLLCSVIYYPKVGYRSSYSFLCVWYLF